jgi:hypothetical protein
MVTLPGLDRVEYLVNRRFPEARWLDLPTSLPGRPTAPRDTRKLRAEVDAYREELAVLDWFDLASLVAAEIRYWRIAGIIQGLDLANPPSTRSA